MPVVSAPILPCRNPDLAQPIFVLHSTISLNHNAIVIARFFCGFHARKSDTEVALRRGQSHILIAKRAKRLPKTSLDNLIVLFPEILRDGQDGFLNDVRLAPDGSISAFCDDAQAAARDGAARCYQLAQAVVRTPPFRPHAPWLSGTVLRVRGGRNAEPGWVDAALGADIPMSVQTEALALARRLVREELGGAYWATPLMVRLPPQAVLVQGGKDEALNAALFAAALAGGGDAARIVLILPEHNAKLAGIARGHGCVVLTGVHDPWSLLADAGAVYAAADHSLAVLARLAGLPVHFCAGERLAEGQANAGIFAAASLLLGARYADPFTCRRIDCAAALDIASEWRRVTRANRGIGVCTGMSFWKRRRIKAFLHDGESAPPHRKRMRPILDAASVSGRSIAAWSSRMPKNLPAFARLAGTRVVRVEDGFLRSRGLGSDFRPPCSIIVDRAGIYYDPSGPSDLETLLLETHFTEALLARARRLIDHLKCQGTTKYGTASGALRLPPHDGRRRVLVPGQVADDLSVLRGGAGTSGNAELLEQVRARNPDALLIYKPHPDVEAGHRAGALPDKEVLQFADLIVERAPMAPLIEAVDEVHTITSLAGFEALLRGRRVVVHGQPFYAGWGLTEDLAPLSRRGRTLSLEALAAGVLLLYPRYFDPVTELPCTAEITLDRLADPALWQPTALIRARRAQGRMLARIANWRMRGAAGKTALF